MTVAAQMLETHPADLAGMDKEKLRACIDACVECAQACTACSDACLAEETVADLRRCIRICADCAEMCGTTGKVVSRLTGFDAILTRAVLEACVTACGVCGEECGKHASMHEHCRACGETCRSCEQACRGLLATLG
jgi:hypothetical protein